MSQQQLAEIPVAHATDGRCWGPWGHGMLTLRRQYAREILLAVLASSNLPRELFSDVATNQIEAALAARDGALGPVPPQREWTRP